MQRVISGIYTSIDGNIYATRKGGSRKPKPAPVTVLRPVAHKMGGVEFTAMTPVNVIKSPRTKRLDKQDRVWYAGLSK